MTKHDRNRQAVLPDLDRILGESSSDDYHGVAVLELVIEKGVVVEVSGCAKRKRRILPPQKQEKS